MTIPKIEHVGGDRNTEYITLTCTGCNEYYSYSVRQYKGDFGCNITEFESFLQWATWESQKHECFAAGRGVYMTDESERHEDPFGEEAMRDDEESSSELHEWLQGEDYWNRPDDDDENDLEDTWEDLGVDDDADEEPFGDNYDWDENRFDFLYGRDDTQTYITIVTHIGHISSRHPTLQEIPRLRSFPPTEVDYAEMERRVADQMLLDAGIYSLDDHGCLRDEKGRCLACLRPGPHFPFYYDKDKR